MYEDNVIKLRELVDGDRFKTKSGEELIYYYALGNDKHTIGRINGRWWDAPNGDYPVRKYKGNE